MASPEADSRTQRYLPQLDGLRGIAILGVLLFHFDAANVGWTGLSFHVGAFDLGWTGVMLFFVLSGYLITEILLAAKGASHYFRDFYARRALRIFPAYYAMLLLAFALASTLSAGDAAGAIREWPFYVFYVSNYWLGVNDGRTPMSQLLGPTWTLSIEEQFYLVWPLIVGVLTRRALVALCAALVLASPLLRWSLMQATGNPTFTAFALVSNFDGLALGALIAASRGDASFGRWIVPRTGLVLAAVSGLALAALVAANGSRHFSEARFWMSATGSLLFFPSLVASFFAGVLVLALTSGSSTVKLLCFRPLVGLGRVSYGVYLYHMPVNFVLTRLVWTSVFLPIPGVEPPAALVALLYVARHAATILVAVVSYRFLERPFLELKSRFAVRSPPP